MKNQKDYFETVQTVETDPCIYRGERFDFKEIMNRMNEKTPEAKGLGCFKS